MSLLNMLTTNSQPASSVGENDILINFETSNRDHLDRIDFTTLGATRSAVRSKFGSYSGAMTSSGNPYAWTGTNVTGDFTFECWMYKTETVPDGDYILPFYAGSNNAQFLVDYGSPKTFGVFGSGLGSGTAPLTVPSNEWVHLALTRAAGVVRCFMNGVQYVSSTPSPASSLMLNYLFYYRPNNGFVDQIALKLGLARWTSDFTPPETPYTS